MRILVGTLFIFSLFTSTSHADCIGGEAISSAQHEARAELRSAAVVPYRDVTPDLPPQAGITLDWNLAGRGKNRGILSNEETVFETEPVMVYSQKTFANFGEARLDLSCALAKLNEDVEKKTGATIDGLVKFHDGLWTGEHGRALVKSGIAQNVNLFSFVFYWNKGYVKNSAQALEKGLHEVRGKFFWSMTVSYKMNVKKVRMVVAQTDGDNEKILDGRDIQKILLDKKDAK